jgi:TonB family protein
MGLAGLVLLLVSVLVGNVFGGENKRAEAEALFTRANNLVGIGKPPLNHYILKAHLRVKFDRWADGTFSKAVLKEAIIWRTEINFPGYSEIAVSNGEGKWIRRTAAFTPDRVSSVLDALNPHLVVREREKVEEITEQTIGQTRARCVKLNMQGMVNMGREVCLDAASGLPLRSRSSWGLRGQVDYEGYSNSGDKQFPARMRLYEQGELVAEFWLDSLSADLPDKALFDPLPDAVFLPVCSPPDKMKAPVPISTPTPDYPEIAKSYRIQGIVALQAVIDEQGHVQDPAVSRSANPILDGEAKATVLKWRYQPAMCGSTPIRVEMNVQVSFWRGH